MRARLVRMEPGYRGRQRIVIEIAGDFREQFDQLQGALLEVQITRAIPRRSLASNNYFSRAGESHSLHRLGRV